MLIKTRNKIVRGASDAFRLSVCPYSYQTGWFVDTNHCERTMLLVLASLRELTLGLTTVQKRNIRNCSWNRYHVFLDQLALSWRGVERSSTLPGLTSISQHQNVFTAKARISKFPPLLVYLLHGSTTQSAECIL